MNSLPGGPDHLENRSRLESEKTIPLGQYHPPNEILMLSMARKFSRTPSPSYPK